MIKIRLFKIDHCAAAERRRERWKLAEHECLSLHCGFSLGAARLWCVAPNRLVTTNERMETQSQQFLSVHNLCSMAAYCSPWLKTPSWNLDCACGFPRYNLSVLSVPCTSCIIFVCGWSGTRTRKPVPPAPHRLILFLEGKFSIYLRS